MSKQLRELTQKQAEHICNLAGEPFISFSNGDHGYWKSLGLEIQICTTTTKDHANEYDSYIRIYKDGRVELSRNNGEPDCTLRSFPINTLPITDYLRSEGFEFEY